MGLVSNIAEWLVEWNERLREPGDILTHQEWFTSDEEAHDRFHQLLDLDEAEGVRIFSPDDRSPSP